MKIINEQKKQNVFKDLKAGEAFRDSYGNVLIKVISLRDTNDVEFNCTHLDLGEHSFKEDEAPVFSVNKFEIIERE